MTYGARVAAEVQKLKRHSRVGSLFDTSDTALLTEIAEVYVPVLDHVEMKLMMKRVFAEVESESSRGGTPDEFPLEEQPTLDTFEERFSALLETVEQVWPNGPQLQALLARLRESFRSSLTAATAPVYQWPKRDRGAIALRVLKILERARPPRQPSRKGRPAPTKLLLRERRLAAALIGEHCKADKAPPSRDPAIADFNRVDRIRRRARRK